MGFLSNYAANVSLDALLHSGTPFIGLHVDDPGVLGDYGTEVSGGAIMTPGSNYERQPVTFTVAGSRTTGNDSQATFLNMPECVITHIAVWDAVTTGNLISYAELDTPINVADGQTFIVSPTAVVVTLV